MTTVNITFSPDSDELFPLYCHFDGQVLAQPAYIELNLETGEVTADYNSEIGNGVPAPVWHGLIQRWQTQPALHRDQIASLLEDNREYFQSVLDRSEVYQDSNYNWCGGLAEQDQEDDPDRFMAVEPEGGIQPLEEQLDGDYYPNATQTVDEYIDTLHAHDGEDNFYYQSHASSRDEVRDMLFDVWADNLYSSMDLPKAVAQALLDDGRCEDSQWMDELREFANQK